MSAPANPGAQRRQLTELASREHPGAKLRSFADGAATLLTPQHLLIAYYEDGNRTRQRNASDDRGEQDEGQDQLFAA